MLGGGGERGRGAFFALKSNPRSEVTYNLLNFVKKKKKKKKNIYVITYCTP